MRAVKVLSLLYVPKSQNTTDLNRATPPHAETVLLFLPSLEGGGAERVFVELANQFASLGVQVELVLVRMRGPYLSEVSPSVRVVDLRARGVLQALPKLVRYLRARRPAAVLSALDHANVVATLASLISRTSVRCVISVRSVPAFVYGQIAGRRGAIILRLMKWVYPKADAVIANSGAVAADLIAQVGLSQERLHTIYNPLDIDSIESLSREPVDHPWCTDGMPPFILSVGSLTAFKDFTTLLRAFAKLRSRRVCRLVILGEGPDREALERLIRDLRIENDVYLPGFLANPFPWMRRAKVFVSSSITEGCPNALMQALACGTAVVSTRSVGGASEILEEGKWGRLVPVGDSDAMAEALEAVFVEQALPDVRSRANDFDSEATARKYLGVLLPSRPSKSIG